VNNLLVHARQLSSQGRLGFHLDDVRDLLTKLGSDW